MSDPLGTAATLKPRPPLATRQAPPPLSPPAVEDLYGHPLIVQHADPSDWNRLHPAGTEEGGGNMESNLSTFSFVAGGTGLGPGRARAMANNYSVARGSQTGNAFRIVQRVRQRRWARRCSRASLRHAFVPDACWDAFCE